MTLEQTGVSIVNIGLRDQLGHQNIETTSLYMTESMEEQISVVARMNKKTNSK